jgi:hypothetical protein
MENLTKKQGKVERDGEAAGWEKRGDEFFTTPRQAQDKPRYKVTKNFLTG